MPWGEWFAWWLTTDESKDVRRRLLTDEQYFRLLDAVGGVPLSSLGITDKERKWVYGRREKHNYSVTPDDRRMSKVKSTDEE